MILYFIIAALVILAGLYLCSKIVFDEEPEFDRFALSLITSGFIGFFWVVTLPALTGILVLYLFWCKFCR